MGSHLKRVKRLNTKEVRNIKGIYKFTNRINNKSYIGQSVSINERYKSHKRNYVVETNNAYNSLFYRALRKYGFENFDYEILVEDDELSKQDLNELEIYYIENFKSFGHGYNMNKGGNYTSSSKKLCETKVNEIKQQLKNTDLDLIKIAENFSVSSSLITMINNGIIWNFNSSHTDYPIRKVINGAKRGGANSNAKLTDAKAIELRLEFVDKTLEQIHLENNDLISFSGLKKLLYGSTFTHLPVYKKRQKQWVLDGTCIDYPRLEE